MRKNRDLLWLLVCVLTLSLTACSNRPDGVLSSSEMSDYLTDLHVLEGAMVHKGMQIDPNDRRPVYYYNALFQKHGITKAQFDSSLVWYAKNPKQFERVYARVIQNLDQLKKDVQAGKYHPDLDAVGPSFTGSYNVWNKDSKYKLTRDSSDNQLKFVIRDYALLTGDQYVLQFQLKAAKVDSCNSFGVIRIHYADGSCDSLYKSTVFDNATRKYTFTIHARRNYQIDSLTGVLAGRNCNLKKDIMIQLDSISLKRNFVPEFQDSLRNHLKVPDKKPVQKNENREKLSSKIISDKKVTDKKVSEKSSMKVQEAQ